MKQSTFLSKYLPISPGVVFLYLSCYLLIACFQPEEGCLDIEASNFTLSADRDCPSTEATCQCTYPAVSANIQHSFDKSAYIPTSVYRNNLGQYFRVRDIQFYISAIQLIREDGLIVHPLDTIILTVLNEASVLENIIFVDDFKLVRLQGSLTLGNIDKSGTFKQLQFTVGIKALENTTEPEQVTPSSHPLAIDSMHLATGYIFNRVVIHRDTTSSEQTILKITKKEGLVNVLLDLPTANKQIGKPLSLGTLTINHAKWFDGINMVEDSEEDMMQKIVGNTGSVFSVQ